ncbi:MULTISPECIES: DNA internalization-related competence protein ComEC/Rec2 [Staphylococcus]|uniref:DNA internalization-related competence protein ComEC/Rec2 n=1 Tax=Staphylococcus TaxID=1279 RepID=UPI0008A3C4DB|nr:MULTISPECIES: DNA internalization-related competence protein ComEC/Rec2 [Staphylococcus]MCH4392004.1 DNA internalization-related competence protein ComEC/Rec2 [Staphylococcus haemolyticus]MCI2950586.1 DNA internalization-related competence protein ComEC/Rec2 [Staphylococcus haemolyticus]OFP28854.1 DNA internalization-related competence protein ComEC/Rec2 [Staphylococcus sp. HMSC068H08]OFS52475.1 DNA internalization-related competence protein ComEC/Rec2 [Staphylococcus sp. HMSC065C09]OHP6583
MIFYELSFLSGILWIHIKWIAILITLLLIIISLQKRLKLRHIFFLIICLFSGLTFEHFHNEYNLNKDEFLKSNSNISTEVQFGSKIEKQERQLKGIFELSHQPFVYYLYSNNLKEKDLENKSCVIKGKIISVLNHTPYVSISNVDLNSCHITKSKNIIEKQRDFIIKKLNNSSLSHPEYVIALVTGDVNGINTDFIDKVKDIGIYHLLAVSGSHIATISFLIYQPLVRLNIPKVIINGLIILFLSIFAYYTGFAPSALRAILATTTVILISNKTKIASIDILGLIFLVMTFFKPDYLYDIGFQFSFIISFFIIISFPLLKKLTFIKNIFVLTFIAQLSSTIISIYHFNQIQWIGLLSNLIFVPFYSFIIFPLAIFLFFAYHFVSDTALPNLVFDKIYIVHNKLLDLFLTFKYYQIFIAPKSAVEFSIFVLLIVLIYIFFCYKKMKILFLFIIVFIVLCVFNVRPNVSTITFFDVGQGDSLIFQTRKQETVMVDTGGKEVKIGNIDNHNIAKYHIIPTLKQKRITKIDHLIITHPHADHIGELPYIAQHIRIKKLYINLYSYSEIELIKIKRLCKINNIELIDATTIQFIQLNNSKISFLHGDIPNSNDKNEHSIILLIEYQRYKMLLPGDVTKNNESKLMKIYQLPKIDILKVAHHGSKTSSSESFINLIKPTISIISSGKNNKYHLPNRETLQTLRSINSSILNTQDVGEITIDLDHDLDIKFKN